MRTIPMILLLAVACTGDTDTDTDKTDTATTDTFADADTDADADSDTDTDADTDTSDTAPTTPKVNNLLVNGDFESDDGGTPPRPTDFLTFVVTGGVANAETAVTGDAIYNSKDTFTAHGGKKGMKLFGQFTGGESFTAVFQEWTTGWKAGTSFELTGWAFVSSDDPPVGTNEAYLFAKFFEDNVNFNLVRFDQSAIINNSSTTDKWVELNISGTVPKGTGFVQFGVEYRNCVGSKQGSGCYDGGGVFFDDLVLTQ
ncbi:MAG: hypothetical protein KTR31_20945 [Myxococcales bacterium]|nr:hypothetical protein [Myxococcales bacterium]